MIPDAIRPPGLARRAGAGMIDLCLLGVAVCIVTWIGLAFQGPAPETRDALVAGIVSLWSGIVAPVAMAAVMIAMALFWSLLRATPGQLVCGSQVVSARSGRSLNLPAALWRALLLFALAGPLGLPLISVPFDRRGRALHDWLSFSLITTEDESRIPLAEWKEMLS